MRRFVLRWSVLLVLPLTLSACGNGGGDEDGGATDAQVDGGGTTDGGGTDGGGTDGGSTDGGGTDGGGTDGGGTDGGGTDGGGTDGGTPTDNTLPVTHTTAAGNSFSLIIDGAGAVWTFGSSLSGQLGNNQIGLSGAHHGDAYAPTRPVNLDAVTMVEVAAGDTHAVGLDSSGAVWAWGGNATGQLGIGLPDPEVFEPTAVTLASPIVAVTAGATHTLALDDTGALWAWGSNGSGELGNTAVAATDVPVLADLSALPAGIGLSQIEAGSIFSLGLATDGTVWVWGAGSVQLGLGGTNSAPTPTRVLGEGGTGLLDRIVAIAAGRDHSLALDEDGVLWAWGDGNSGQFGNGIRDIQNVPVRVDLSGVTGTITGLRAGRNQSFALLSDGSVLGWGENDMEQLGLPTGDVLVPTTLPIPGSVLDLASSPWHSIAADDAGGFWGWGENLEGVQGTGWVTASPTPRPTYGPAGLTPIGLWPAKEAYSFIQLSDRSVWGVGRGFGQSGSILGGASPVLVEPLVGLDVEQIAAGAGHTLILDTAGAVWGMGSNNYGQLGDGTIVSSTVPVPVDFSMLPAGTTITEVGVGSACSVALASDGTVWVWGRGQYGQLGNDSSGNGARVSVPSQVMDSVGTGFLGGIADIAVGHDHIVAQDGAGLVWTWGLASNGQLGNTPLHTCTSSGNACNRLPQQVCDVGSDPTNCTLSGPWLGAVDAIAAGQSHTLLLRSGQVLGFGSKTQGQVGDNTWNSTVRAQVPINVVNEANDGPLIGIASIAAGNQTSYAVGTDGTVYGWGDNALGQLAKDPTTTACGTSRRCLPRPTSIPELAGLTLGQFAAGSNHAMVLDSTNTIWSWGRNDNGELGQLSRVSSPGGSYIGFLPAPILLLPR